MIDLEDLSESIGREIDELDGIVQQKKMNKDNIRVIISNLRDCNDLLYRAFEEIDVDANQRLQKENEVLRFLLKDRLTDFEDQYIRLTYGIEV